MNSLYIIHESMDTKYSAENVEFFFYIRVMKIWMQILWQEIQKCLFHISKHGHMKHGIFTYLSFENICEVFPSWNIEYCLFNIWKTFVNFPTSHIEFSHRFSCLGSEILYIFIKNVWKVFWYEIWNSVYFPFDNLGRNVLIWNMNSQFFKCENTFQICIHEREFPVIQKLRSELNCKHQTAIFHAFPENHIEFSVFPWWKSGWRFPYKT